MLYQILPRKSYQFSFENTLMLFKSLAIPQKKKGFLKKLVDMSFDFRFIIDCDKSGLVAFYFWTKNDNDSILNTLQVWCGADADVFPAVHELEEYHKVIDTIYTYEQKSEDGKIKNIASYSNEMIFLNIIGSLEKYTRVTIDFKVAKSSTQKEGTRYRMSSTSDVELEMLLRVYGKTVYDRNKVQAISHKICNLTSGDKQMLVDYKDSWKVSKVTGSEMANIFQIPTLYRKDDKFLKTIQYLRPGQTTLSQEEFNKGIVAGKLYHPMQNEREIKILEEELRKHMIITGTTGSGKTSQIEEIIFDILLRMAKGEKNVPGFTFFDPAESSVLGVLDMILKLKSDGHDIEELLKKVIYVDFKDSEYIFPMSLLNKNVEANELLEFLNSLFPDLNAIQVERMMNSAVNALMMDHNEHSIFDIEKLFLDDEFREELIHSLQHNIYAQNEINFLKGKFNAQVTAPILNRIDPFGNSRTKKLMFGMTSEYDALKDLRKWMDEGYIVLFNIKGFNSFEIKTIVGYYALQCYRTALKRPDFSLLHMLIIDEDHKVQLPIAAKIAAETRKQGLSINLMTQQMEQYGQDYLQKIIGNINTVISYRQNEDRACRNVKSFILSEMDIQDFKTLPDLVGYLSTTDVDNQKKSVLIKVKPPYRYTDGRLVDYKNNKDVEYNLNKNRKFAKEIMSKCMMPRKVAESIVFHKVINKQEQDRIENVLLEEGDSLLSAQEGIKIEWEE